MKARVNTFSYGYIGLSCAGQGRAIPRVDTFASNLHDSWGAHALHDSPPTAEGGALGDPPRLSTESARSATSQASKASSGEHTSLSPLSIFLSVVPFFLPCLCYCRLVLSFPFLFLSLLSLS